LIHAAEGSGPAHPESPFALSLSKGAVFSHSGFDKLSPNGLET
jgi:hypothetical protein